MKYPVEMGSGGMMYIPSFIKIGSGIQRLMGWAETQVTWLSHKPMFILFKIREEG
jgi:hypothetical protein